MDAEQAHTGNAIDGQLPPAKGRRQRRQLEAAERRRQALTLKISGATYETIAQAVGYKHRASALKAIRSALKDITREPAEELRTLELERLDSMLLAIAAPVRAGHLGAIDRALRIMERRARLLGLDAPTKIAATTPTGEALPVRAFDYHAAIATITAGPESYLFTSGADQDHLDGAAVGQNDDGGQRVHSLRE